MMVSNRDFTLRTTKGAARFEKDVPRPVSPLLVDEALAVGVIPVDGKDLPANEEPKIPAPVIPSERKKAIEEAIDTMDARAGTKAGREDWTAARRPKVAVVAKLVGFKVHADEINRIISERNEAKNAEMLAAKKNPAKGNSAVTEEPDGGEDYGR
jgi:hypothetical protein